MISKPKVKLLCWSGVEPANHTYNTLACEELHTVVQFPGLHNITTQFSTAGKLGS